MGARVQAAPIVFWAGLANASINLSHLFLLALLDIALQQGHCPSAPDDSRPVARDSAHGEFDPRGETMRLPSRAQLPLPIAPWPRVQGYRPGPAQAGLSIVVLRSLPNGWRE